MRLGIKGLDVYALRPVLSSKAFLDWLKPFIKAMKQEDVADAWGVKQPTISRILRQVKYDIPLDTVAKIATAFGYGNLSDFFLHVERNLPPNTELTSPVTSLSDKRTASTLNDVGGGSHDSLGVSQADIRRGVIDVLTRTLTALHADELKSHAADTTPKPDRETRKSPKLPNKRRAGGR